MCFPFCTGKDRWSRWGLRQGVHPGPGAGVGVGAETQMPTKFLRRTASTLSPSMHDLKKLRRKTPLQKTSTEARPGPAPAQWRPAPTFLPKTPASCACALRPASRRLPTLGDVLFFSRSVVSDSLRSHGLQHARLPCPHIREFVQTHVHLVIPFLECCCP